jgi:ribosomal protein S18 acetylase RimI-like enzyme
VVDVKTALAAYDEQIRRRQRPEKDVEVEADEHVVRIVARLEGWSGVVWSDLSSANADAVITAQIHRFRRLGRGWEWKYYSYDRPADLRQRLIAAGLVPDPPEALLVAEIAELDIANPSLPTGVQLRRVADERGVRALVHVHDQVFGADHGGIGRRLLVGLREQPSAVAAVIAVADGRPVSAGRVEFHAGTDFASLWGGGTLPEWRGQGLFRAIVAYRVALARERGFRYVQVDASPESRPILERLGFVALATTIPYRA